MSSKVSVITKSHLVMKIKFAASWSGLRCWLLQRSLFCLLRVHYENLCRFFQISSLVAAKSTAEQVCLSIFTNFCILITILQWFFVTLCYSLQSLYGKSLCRCSQNFVFIITICNFQLTIFVLLFSIVFFFFNVFWIKQNFCCNVRVIQIHIVKKYIKLLHCSKKLLPIICLCHCVLAPFLLQVSNAACSIFPTCR